MYDEVDEDVYRSVVRGRLMEDDFIEEDNGVSGYADHGMDEWDRSGSEKDEDADEGDDSMSLSYGGSSQAPDVRLTLLFRQNAAERRKSSPRRNVTSS